MTDNLLHQLTAKDLQEIHQEASRHIAAQKAVLTAVENELQRRFEVDGIKKFSASGKMSGTQPILLDENVELVAEVSKKVDWNAELLKGLPAETMDLLGIKVSIAVPEKSYEKLSEGALKDLLTSARTVKYGKMKIGFRKPEKEEA